MRFLVNADNLDSDSCSSLAFVKGQSTFLCTCVVRWPINDNYTTVGLLLEETEKQNRRRKGNNKKYK